MKKFFKVIGILIAIAILVALGYLLVRKIKADTIAQRDLQIEANNIQAEAEFLCDRATKKLTTLIDEIETAIHKKYYDDIPNQHIHAGTNFLVSVLWR